MACIVFKACNAGARDTYAFRAPEDLDLPTEQADTQPSEWLAISEEVQEMAKSMCALDPGEEFTIGVDTSTDDPGAARLFHAKTLWCGGYYEMPEDESDGEIYESGS